MKVGMHLTPHWAEIVSISSTSTLTKVTLGYLVESSSKKGAILWQGPHQVAVKSITTWMQINRWKKHKKKSVIEARGDDGQNVQALLSQWSRWIEPRSWCKQRFLLHLCPLFLLLLWLLLWTKDERKENVRISFSFSQCQSVGMNSCWKEHTRSGRDRERERERAIVDGSQCRAAALFFTASSGLPLSKDLISLIWCCPWPPEFSIFSISPSSSLSLSLLWWSSVLYVNDLFICNYYCIDNVNKKN